MDNEKRMQLSDPQTIDYRRDVNHVGGINEGLGGVDPQADENLIRLSGGN